ncbi:MAG: protein kinase [Planctomycetes bacterium]|nr:protein kinase [Planctomycetota bacterium]
MVDEPDTPGQPDADDSENQPDPGPTRRLDKAIEDMESGDIAEGTLVSIEAHTGEHPIPPGPSVTDALKQQKGKGKKNPGTPDIQPAATMYEPTQPGHVSGGSTQKTVFGPTGTGGTPQSGSLNSGSAPRPVAPFGGKIVVGTRFGQIEVTGVLGKGGMGEVFKGYHHALDINVAIKVLPDELSRNELVRQRFLREARLCVKLDHPHIVRVFNVDEYAGNLYLVMEMIEGTDAAHMLKNGGRFRYKRALEIGAASADALAYAHTQGLVHRDVKPHNILLGASDGKIKISDFGLARAATSSSHLTMSGQIMGTPHYMSPEQAESKEVSDKSDVYSLGVTLYHMLTGETPFVGDTPISVAVQHIAKEIIYPEIRFKPFPKELVAVLKRMTAKDASKRCSAKQAAVWLRKLITMAPADDIRVDDEQAMKSMAPVVRESQAFEAAAKERQRHDAHARELAQTMLATIQEDSARRPAVQQPTASEPAYQSAAQPAQKGSGTLITAVVAVTLLVVGGAAAAWYFLAGPGAAKANNDNAPIIAGGNTDNSAPPANSGGGGNGNGNSNTTPPSNGDNSGNNTAPENNEPSDDGGIDDSGPPAEIDDPIIAAYLAGALSSITAADKLADLEAVERKLTQARLDIRSGKGSAAQREQFKELEARFNVQKAYLGTIEGMDNIRTALKGFDSKRGSNHAEAISFLNTAIAERDKILKLKVPEDTEQIIGEDRDALLEKLNSSLDGFWSEIDDQAKALESKKQYTEAQALLAELASIKNTAEKVAAVDARLQEARIYAIHTTIEKDLLAKNYRDALLDLEQADRVGVPESLKAAHEKVIASVGLAIETEFTTFISNAQASADKSDYTAAHNALDSAKDLPGRTQDQKARYADCLYYVNLSEHIYNTEAAITSEKLQDGRKALDKADALVAASASLKQPAELITRLGTVRASFDAKLNEIFDGLLSAADAAMKAKDFAGAGDNLTEAGKLPYTKEQGERLEAFKTASLTALSDFVRGLIADIEKALDSNDFETASEKLASIPSLPVPDDMKPKLKELQDRFDKEAGKRLDELVATAEAALDKKDFDAARVAIDEALKIPASETQHAKATALEDKYNEVIAVEVDLYLKRADDLLHDEKLSEPDRYTKSRDELDKAALLHVPEDLARKIKNKRTQWAAALEARFAQLLADAKTAQDNHLFNSSAQLLSDAKALPINNDQLVRAKVAQDEHDAAVGAYKDDLFKQLEDCVAKGLEKEGLLIIAKLERYDLTPSEQLKIKRLAAALTGETETARRNRLPRYLEKLWGNRYCRPQQLINVGEEISAVAVTADGKFGAAGTNSGKILFYNLKRGTQLSTSSGGRRRITAIAFSADGSLAACGNGDGAVVLFEISGTSVQATNLSNVSNDVSGLAFDIAGNTLYVASRDAQITRFNPKTKAKLGSFATGLDNAFCMEISPDNKWLAVGGDDGRIAVFDANRLVLKMTLDGPGDDKIMKVAFSSDSNQLMGGSIGNDVGIWDMQKLTDKPTKEFKGLSEWIQGVGFSEDGRRCAAFDNEERIVFWDAGSGSELDRYEFSDKLKGDKDFWASAGVIGPDGTVLIGTREGELLHMHVRPAG